MNFGYFFRLQDKTTTPFCLSPEERLSTSPDRFAWIDLDMSEPMAVDNWLMHMGVSRQELEEWQSMIDASWYLHRQKLILEWIPLCRWDGQNLHHYRMLICMTDSLILTAHTDSTPVIDQTRLMCEDSFRSVGRTPGFIYFLLWDQMVDGFMPIYTELDDRLDDLEESYLQGNTGTEIFQNIIKIKRSIRTLKQSLAPMQRTMRHLVSSKMDLISEESLRYLNLQYENLERLSAVLDSLQDRSHATLDGYNSLLSQQTNNSLKILTIFTTILMPLSLIAGIYGTNFAFVPEFTWRYSYFVFWGVLILLSMLMVFFLKRKKWL